MRAKRYPDTARGAALEVLCRVDEDKAYSSQTLDTRRSKLNRQDSALASRLVYGTLQKRIYLDYRIAAVSGRDIGKFDAPVRNSLRLGAYQLLFCDKIPASAAVNEAVEAVKICGFTSAAGLVNAVLHKLISSDETLPEEKYERLAIEHSIPLWLIHHFKKHYKNEDLGALLSAFDAQPGIFLRVNTLRTTDEELMQILTDQGINAKKTAVSHAIEVDRLPPLDVCEAFRLGLFHVQDLSSQLCAQAVDMRENQRMLDMCSAPGGKSFTAAQTAGGVGEIVSCDIHGSRVKLIANGAGRLGIDCIKAAQADATVFNESLGKFDRVLCDVPCSGLGVIRRKPEIRYKDESELEKYPKLQLSILQNGAKYLKNGGRLVYSTCTLDPAENERTAARFLDSNRDFSPAPLFEGGNEAMRTFFPHKDGTDGFFMAAFIKNGDGL